MTKKAIVLAAILSMAATIAAEDPSEKGIPTSPLTIYSGGIGVGAFRSLNKDLQAEQEIFLKVSFENTVYFKENIGVFIDVDWFIPGNNYGADLGFDFIPVTGSFRPFIGAGVGAHYFDKTGKFGDNIGPSGTVHIGVALDLTNRVQMRIRVPYFVTADKANDQTIGAEIGFLFSGRFKNIKKLNYN
jgi:hypothetical protein